MLCAMTLLAALLCSSLAQNPALLARFRNSWQLSASPRYDLYWAVDSSTS